MSRDDLSGKTWTDDLSPGIQRKRDKDLGITSTTKESSPDSLKFTDKQYPIPGFSFEEWASDITELLPKLDTYVSANQKFTAEMRNISDQLNKKTNG